MRICRFYSGLFTQGLALALVLAVCAPAHGQGLLRQMKERAEEVKDDIVDRLDDEDEGPSGSTPPGPQQPGAASAQPAGSDGSVSGAANAVAFSPYVPLSAVPSNMLVFKFAPESFSESDLLQRATSQIQQDQTYYGRLQAGNESVGTTSGASNQPLFAAGDVEGRNPAFAATELLDEYREKLTGSAGEFPTRYSAVISVDVQRQARYDHARGLLHATNETEHLIRARQATNTRNVPVVEGHALYEAQVLTAFMSSVGYNLKAHFGFNTEDVPDSLARLTPVSMANNTRRPQLVFALDRALEVPVLALSSAEAERLLTPPRTPGLSEAANVADRDAQMEQYAQEQRSFLGALLLVLDLEIQDIVPGEARSAAVMKVLGGRLFGSRGELLQTLEARDFPAVAELRAEARDRDAAGEAAAAAQRREQERTRDAALARMDLLGVRLGMPLGEAESVLRRDQAVETVYRFSPAPPPPAAVARAMGRNFQPYDGGLLFIANDGKDTVALFVGAGDEVIGVGRRLAADGLTPEALNTALMEKYGAPTAGDDDSWTWGQTRGRVSCAGQGALDAQSRLELLEGPPIDNVTYRAAGIGVRGEATAAALAECGTVLYVHSSLAGLNPYVQFRLFDHGHPSVAGALKDIEDGAGAAEREAAGGLTL